MNTSAEHLPNAPRPPGVVRRWFAAHPKFVDRFIAGMYLFGSALMFLIDAGGYSYLYGLGRAPVSPLTVAAIITFYVAATAVIFWVLLNRRKRPFVGFVIVTIICAAESGNIAQSLPDAVAMAFMLYAVAVYDSVRGAWIAFAIGSVGTAINAVVWQDELGFGGVTSAAVGGAGFLLLTVLIGINIGNRVRYVSALVDRAAMLERDREQLARIAVSDERERIAREMHDIVAHSLSVMIALSEGSARSLERAPDKSREAMQHAAETGRTALADMRRLLGVLKGEADAAASLELAPQPGIENIAALVEDFRRAGLELHTESVGEAPADSGFGLAVYRIVQETLTNALRYAGSGARVNLSITHGTTPAATGGGVGTGAPLAETVITVRDFGRVSSATPPLDELGTGNGLVGLAERARMFGGEVRAGAHPAGGWIVIATLPWGGGVR